MFGALFGILFITALIVVGIAITARIVLGP
jgi:hypothetical protein